MEKEARHRYLHGTPHPIMHRPPTVVSSLAYSSLMIHSPAGWQLLVRPHAAQVPPLPARSCRGAP